MKNKLLIALLFSGVFFTLCSCKKEWICTCTAQSTVTGQANLDVKDTIPLAVKPAAQADCDKFCSTYTLQHAGYSDLSSSIAKQ